MYQRCPFCDRVFEIGKADYRPMKAHIRAVHADASGITAEVEGAPRSGNTAD